MKLKTVYTCEKCGYSSPKWIGKCPDCNGWNTLNEEVIAKNETREHRGIAGETTRLNHDSPAIKRLSTKINELDQVLGGGIMEGSVILMSGEPGIGKSTLTLDICKSIAEEQKSVLYISGEESVQQISERAKRMGIKNENISLLGENHLENIIATFEKTHPDFVIIDSIQVVSSGEMPSIAGSITQVRYCTEILMSYAKKNNIPMIIIGHVTKDGNLAGPKILEHLVDVVLLIEGERHQNLRLIRGIKNRYGSTNEVGIFEMTENGLKEIDNASKLFLEGRKEGSFGSAITATVEGTRPLLLEVQALTNISPFGYPKRAASGFDLNRLQLLIAVLQKHINLNLSNQDVFVNVVGGFRLNDPSADLAVTMAIISSYRKEALDPGTVYIGEIGLAGELRSVSHLTKRLKEAEKIGFTKAVIPKNSGATNFKKLTVQSTPGLQELMKDSLTKSRKSVERSVSFAQQSPEE